MRTSEYYARGIYSFFIGYGLDAVERHRGVTEAPEKAEPEPTPGRVSAEDEDFDYDDVPPERCCCLSTAYLPCSFCESGDGEGGGVTVTATDVIEVPHGERSGNPLLDAEFIIAEAMILDLERGMGRIKYRPAAEHAVRSLVAAGWTPPASNEADDETSRLRALIDTMRAQMDEDNAHMHCMHEAEQAAILAHQRISMAAMNQAFKLEKEAAAAVKVRHEPEPTMTYTEIAKGLHKLSEIGKNAAKRDQKKAAKAEPVETAAVTLPGLENAL